MDFEVSPWQPCSFFKKKLSKETYLYFHRSIQIAKNLVKKLLFWPTFWKSGSKKSCFSWFSGNPADRFFPKSNQLNFKRKHAFVPNLVMIRHSVRKLSCLRTPLPPPKKNKKKVHISSIFHDSSRTKVRFDLARLEKKDSIFYNSNIFLFILYELSLILM